MRHPLWHPGRRLVALAALGLLAALALAVTACGSDQEARQTLDRAFRTPIGSADVALDAGVTLKGGRQSGQPMRLQLRGPYRSGNGRQIPSGSVDVNVAAQGQSVAAKLISTGNNAWVVFMGQPYEVGTDTIQRANQQIASGQSQRQKRSLSAFGIDPRAWLKDPSVEGDETVSGVNTTHIAAGVDLPRLLDDLNKVSQRASGQTGGAVPSQLPPEQRARIERIIQNPKFDVFVGKDNKIRRLATVLNIDVPDQDRQALNGLQSGKISFSIEFSNVGHPGPITPPSSARPIKDLTGELARLLGSGAPGAGGSVTPGTGTPAPGTGR